MLIDAFYILMMILPLLCALIIKILTKSFVDRITITGPQIYFTLNLPFGTLPITEAQTNSFFVMAFIVFLCLYFTHGLKTVPNLKRQYIAELIVEKIDSTVSENMGDYFSKFSPFIISLFALSLFSSLTSLLGLFPPTADINTVGGWAILVFALITFFKFKAGLWIYLKSFTKPAAFLTPINIISEIATPVSMSFRHFGNILSGTVIMSLISFSLSKLSAIVLSPISRLLADIPIFQIGIPSILSLYFDLFSAVLQAFIFVMLTMLNISGGLPSEVNER